MCGWADFAPERKASCAAGDLIGKTRCTSAAGVENWLQGNCCRWKREKSDRYFGSGSITGALVSHSAAPRAPATSSTSPARARSRPPAQAKHTTR